MLDDSSVIESIELAKDGVVSSVYPLEDKTKALGIDLFPNSAHQADACYARDNDRYTISGPFEMVQGGTGALILDPIYQTGAQGGKTFWGFAVLAVNWENFIQELGLNQLDESVYHYRIWKRGKNQLSFPHEPRHPHSAEWHHRPAADGRTHSI